MSKKVDKPKVEKDDPIIPVQPPKNDPPKNDPPNNQPESVLTKVGNKLKSKFTDKQQEEILADLSGMIEGTVVLTKDKQKSASEFILILSEGIKENSSKKGKEKVKEVLEMRDSYTKTKKKK